MSIEQEIDTKVKTWIGDLTVQNIARQARIDELTQQLAQAQAAAQSQHDAMVEPELPMRSKNNGAVPAGY